MGKKDQKIIKLQPGAYHFPGVAYYDLNRLDTYYPKDPNTMGVEIHPDGWGQVEPEEGVYNWKPLDAILELYEKEGKQAAIRIQCASFQPDDTPRWLYNRYGVRRICAESVFTSFENGTDGYHILKGATLCRDTRYAPAAYTTTYLRGTGDLLSTGLRKFSQTFGQTIGFDYYAISDGILTVSVKRDDTIRIVEKRTVDAGQRGSVNIDVAPEIIGGNAEVLWHFQGIEVTIGNPGVSEDRPGLYSVGNVCYPNYFDPVFKAHYASFVHAFAARYRDRMALSAICVGGYGRWDEVSLDLVPEQWKAFGYTPEKYLEHMKWCANLFEDAFAGSQKQIFMHGYTEWLPGDRAQADYLSRKTMNFIVDRGLGLKTNSLQAKLTEWDSEGGVAWSYMLNRIKHSGVSVFHEEAAQCANTMACFNNMGHPLSMLNRAIIDGVNYYWLYESDLYTPYFAKYLHYANEQAGTGLFTRLYILFGDYPFIQRDGKITHSHPNICNGLWLREHDWTTFAVQHGRNVLLADVGSPVELSVDDRQKYNSMYGSVLTIDYWDTSGGAFSVFVREDGKAEDTLLGTVRTKGTGVWQSVSFYATSWGRSWKNQGRDNMVEIRIVPLADSTQLVFSGVTVDYVPAREWLEEVLIPANETEEETDADGVELILPVPEGKRLSSIMLPVCTVNPVGPSNLMAAVEALLPESRRVAVTQKEFYMASELHSEMVLPVAEAPENTVGFRISLKTLAGTMAIFLNQLGNPAVELRGYMVAEEKSPDYSDSCTLEAGSPFCGIQVGREYNGAQYSLFRQMGQTEALVGAGQVVEGYVYPEPQTAGKYRLMVGDKPVRGKLLTLQRLEPASAPCRQLIGTQPAAGFDVGSPAMWHTIKGLETTISPNGGMTAVVREKAPLLESVAFSVKAEDAPTFHMVLKNETGSAFVRVFWKTQTTPNYTETNSVLIPVLSNDTAYREYCWPIGAESGYSGLITGLLVQPVTGETCTGTLSVLLLELRTGTEDQTGGQRIPLEQKDILDGSAGTKFFAG